MHAYIALRCIALRCVALQYITLHTSDISKGVSTAQARTKRRPKSWPAAFYVLILTKTASSDMSMCISTARGSAQNVGLRLGLRHFTCKISHKKALVTSLTPQAPCQSFLTLEPAACSRHVTEQWYNKAKPSENKWKLCKQHQSNDSFFQSQKMPHWLQVKHALSSWTWGCNRMQSTPPFPQGKTAPKAQACRMSSHHLSNRVAPTRPVNPFWLEIQNVTKGHKVRHVCVTTKFHHRPCQPWMN